MMKKHKGLIITLIIILIALCGGGIYLHGLLSGGVVTMDDIMTTVKTVAQYFIPLAILLVVIIALLIIFRKKSPKFKFWLKWESALAFVTALVATLNVVFFVPMETLFNLNYAKMGKISIKTLNESAKVAQDITDEGTVLLKNDNNALPLKANSNINVFGWASTNPIYGGTGSGSTSTANAIDIYKGLKDAGFKTNSQLKNFYTKYQKTRPSISMMAADWTLPEPKASSYSTSMMNQAKNFSDTALVVISRSGGEGFDLPKRMGDKGVTYKGNKGDFKADDTYLQLSKSERDMLSLVNKNFKKVIVLVNSANPMELGFLNEYSNIKGALLMEGPGATAGFESLGRVLKGSVNPSGRTVDTYAYDLKSTPTYNNFGNYTYSDQKHHYVNYSEGIYNGYKFYETYYNGNQAGYDKAVQYPFGYGLSYTTFKKSMSNLKTNLKGKISFDVTVKNTGKVAGKDVVETYYTAPYTNGGVEKSSTNLLNFKKTKNLKPGQSQTLHFTLNREDMASYDTANGGSYVLDQGNYQIQVKDNSHDVVASKDYHVGTKVVYTKRSSDKTTVKNQFGYAKGDVTYLSRKDNFANLATSTKAAPAVKTLTASVKNQLSDVKQVTVNKNDKMPTTGAHNDVKLSNLRGKSYNSPLWDKLLDNMTYKQMNKLITYGGYQTVQASSIGLKHTYDFDGPAGYSSFMVKGINATSFPVAATIASTWNKDLANKRGQMMGKQGKELGVSGWYGPAMNLHRSAFGGRDFEYYSEDGTISGYMAVNEIKGAKKYGVYAYMKHFALNNQETNRCNMLVTWANEPAIRENYLKPFEMSVKKGGVTAVMSSFNYIGTKWSGANKELLTNVLRKEWGFHGLVETDYYGGYGYMSGEKAIAAGNDLMLSTTGKGMMGDFDAPYITKKDATTVKNMRKACHDIMYTIVNSREYSKDNKQGNMLPWQKTVVTFDVIAGIVVVALEVLAAYIYRRRFTK